jgi:hypothetical protein
MKRRTLIMKKNTTLRRTGLIGGTAALAVAAGTVMAAAPASAASTSVWDKVAQCESSGNWSANTGNGYYGGLQFSAATWKAYGGTGLASDASKATQIAIAKKVLAAQGPGAWPVCSVQAGLTKANGGADSGSTDTGSSSDETASTSTSSSSGATTSSASGTTSTAATAGTTVTASSTQQRPAVHSSIAWQRTAKKAPRAPVKPRPTGKHAAPPAPVAAGAKTPAPNAQPCPR